MKKQSILLSLAITAFSYALPSHAANLPTYSADMPGHASDTLSIFGGKDHSVFLGCINCGKNDEKSILNPKSAYSLKKKKGFWSDNSPYNSWYSKLSACNSYANNPPVIKNQDNKVVAVLSANRYSDESVCSLTRPSKLCTIVNAVCEAQQQR